MTAHARAYGGALKLAQDFRGPMAKQHRMFTVTLACLLSAIELAVNKTTHSLEIALWVIVVGASLTWVRRLLAMAAKLRQEG